MKEYKVSVYNYIDKFHDEYTVFATTKRQAIAEVQRRIFIETDYGIEDYDILEVKEITENE